MAGTSSRPKFSHLPLRMGDPPFSAWGLYGENDQLGTLNLLTEDVVKKAAGEEIQSGKRISLQLPLGALEKPFFGRQPFEHRLVNKAPRTVNDDIWIMNSQSSTQWDGLRHFAYQSTKQFYNNTTISDINTPNSTTLGLHHVAQQGIVGRGVLLDMQRYFDKHDIPVDHFSDYCITRDQLESCAKEQGVGFRQGDVLLTRTGFGKRLMSLSAQELAEKAGLHPKPGHRLVGVENCDEMLEWLWENGFAAVGGDQPAFESLPSKREMWMHEVLLAGWGCPIGEFFDLEELSEHCQKVGRWTFFFVSEPCNVIGAVGSPPNALAIV